MLVVHAQDVARLLGAAVSDVREAVSVYVRLGFMSLVDEATSWASDAEVAAATAGSAAASTPHGGGAGASLQGLAPDAVDGECAVWGVVRARVPRCSSWLGARCPQGHDRRRWRCCSTRHWWAC